MNFDRVYTHVIITPAKIQNIFITPENSLVPLSCRWLVPSVTSITYYQTSLQIISQLGSETIPVLLNHQYKHHVTYMQGKKKANETKW